MNVFQRCRQAGRCQIIYLFSGKFQLDYSQTRLKCFCICLPWFFKHIPFIFFFSSEIYTLFIIIQVNFLRSCHSFTFPHIGQLRKMNQMQRYIQQIFLTVSARRQQRHLNILMACIRTYVAKQSESFIFCAYCNQPYLLLFWITRFKSLASKNPVVGNVEDRKTLMGHFAQPPARTWLFPPELC